MSKVETRLTRVEGRVAFASATIKDALETGSRLSDMLFDADDALAGWLRKQNELGRAVKEAREEYEIEEMSMIISYKAQGKIAGTIPAQKEQADLYVRQERQPDVP